MRRKPAFAAIIVLAVALSWAAWPSRHGTMQAPPPPRAMARIEILDVGQGDSILIRSPEGKAALIDAGPTRDGALDLLRREGVASIDVAVVSHHHGDHYGGMAAVLREFKPRYFVATGSAHATVNYLRLLEVVKSEGLTAVVPSSTPRNVALGSVTITILPQPPEDAQEENDNSIGLRVQYGGFSMLSTGDSEAGERRWWLAHCPELVRGCSVLKLAHHGSRNGTDAAWLKVVAPKLAVVSVGAGNVFGHPHPETIALLKRFEIPLLRTDEMGTIVLTSDGATWDYATHGGLKADAQRRRPAGMMSETKPPNSR